MVTALLILALVSVFVLFAGTVCLIADCGFFYWLVMFNPVCDAFAGVFVLILSALSDQ